MDRPTVAQVKARSEFLTPRTDEAVGVLLDEAIGVVASLTGRNVGLGDAPGDSPTGCEWEDVPTWMVPVALRAVTLQTEAMAGVSATKVAKSRGGRLLASFTAGPYSESYFAPDAAAKAKALSPDPTISDILWSLATECVRAYWLRIWGIVTAQPAAGAPMCFTPQIRDHPRY